MLNHHEPSIADVDFASLPADQREAIVEAAIRRARTERSKAVASMARSFFRLLAFRSGGQGGDAPASGTPRAA
jgi:hypothetical protein